jgi:hypothetical protein
MIPAPLPEGELQKHIAALERDLYACDLELNTDKRVILALSRGDTSKGLNKAAQEIATALEAELAAFVFHGTGNGYFYITSARPDLRTFPAEDYTPGWKNMRRETSRKIRVPSPPPAWRMPGFWSAACPGGFARRDSHSARNDPPFESQAEILFRNIAEGTGPW